MVRNIVLQGSNKEQKVSDIVSGVSDVVSEMCSCSFVTDIIRSYEFSCRGSVSSVVFRAELKYYSYTEEYAASDFVEIISSWVENGASLVVDDSRLSVDSTCPTYLESFETDDCQSSSPPPTSESPTPSASESSSATASESPTPSASESFSATAFESPNFDIPSPSASNNIMTVIGGVAAACFIFLVATLVLSVSLVAAVLRYKRKGVSVRYVVIDLCLSFCMCCLVCLGRHNAWPIGCCVEFEVCRWSFFTQIALA